MSTISEGLVGTPGMFSGVGKGPLPGLRTEYGPALHEAPKMLTLAEDASRELAEIVRSSGRPMLAEWELADGPRGSRFLVLRLKDLTETGAVVGARVTAAPVTAVFEPEGLERTSLSRRSRLLEAWGDSLRRQEDLLWEHYRSLPAMAPDEGE